MSEFAELVAATNYSFLRGASHPKQMVGEAIGLGMRGIGIADRNTVAGVVRAHVALKEARAQFSEAWAKDRVKHEQKTETRFVSIDKAELVNAEARDRAAQLTVRFVSQMISA